ncbi:MAG: ABC transporter substrate-binding protein [Pseudobdellovibrionaceae bacterium]
MFKKTINILCLFFTFHGTAFAKKDNSVVIACGSVGEEFIHCKKGVEAWEKITGNSAKFISIPSTSNDRLAVVQQLLASGLDSIDVLQIDTIWPGILANHLLDLTEKVDRNIIDLHFKEMIDNNKINEKLVALPWFTDIGLLYYRKDLLEKYKMKVPETWQQMGLTALQIQQKERQLGQKDFWGFIFQGRAYEGLTCNALEWIASFGGGKIIDPVGMITVNNPQANNALRMIGSWIDNISPKGVLNYSEEEGRGIFQSGKAMFMRNWPYAWSLLQSEGSSVKDKVGVTLLPSGQNNLRGSTLGGSQLSISKYSKRKDLALDLVLFLTSKNEQRRRAIEGSFAPTIYSLYEDKEVIKMNSYFSILKEGLKTAISRPSNITKMKYNQVSSAIWNAVHSSLSKPTETSIQLAGLERRLTRISKNSTWDQSKKTHDIKNQK